MHKVCVCPATRTFSYKYSVRTGSCVRELLGKCVPVEGFFLYQRRDACFTADRRCLWQTRAGAFFNAGTPAGQRKSCGQTGGGGKRRAVRKEVTGALSIPAGARSLAVGAGSLAVGASSVPVGPVRQLWAPARNQRSPIKADGHSLSGALPPHPGRLRARAGELPARTGRPAAQFGGLLQLGGLLLPSRRLPSGSHGSKRFHGVEPAEARSKNETSRGEPRLAITLAVLKDR